MLYINNTFSLQMIDQDVIMDVRIRPLSVEQARAYVHQTWMPWISAIGDADTAAAVSNVLGVEVPMNHITVKLQDDDIFLVAQTIGGRFPEDFTMKFFEVRVIY